MPINENTLEQAIIAELQGLGYEYLYGPDIERDYHEVLLEDCVKSSLMSINPGITMDILNEAYKAIKDLGLLRLEELNASFHKLMIEGIPVSYQQQGENRTFNVKVVDFLHPEKNNFKVINQYTIIEHKQKRPDVIVFINGIPMVLFELKNMANDSTTVENAYKQIKNYQLDIPSLFYYNAFNVISDGIDTRVGTITSDFTRYMAWKSENGEKPAENATDFFAIMLNGMMPPFRLLDIMRNFIVFQDIQGKTVKILAGYHQYFAVRKSVARTKEALKAKSRKVA